jgi:hypothetical protein
MEVELWRKAARSQGANNCVEVSSLDAIRDSKNPDRVLPGLASPLVRAIQRGDVGRRG